MASNDLAKTAQKIIDDHAAPFSKVDYASVVAAIQAVTSSTVVLPATLDQARALWILMSFVASCQEG